jgi:diguanylate cyclase (GGDEF)-like protein/PAS domain S-box-containing protein
MNYRGIVENAVDAICVINEDNIVEYANPSFLNLVGYDLEEVLLKDFSLVLPPEIAPMHKDLIQKFVREGGFSRVLGKVRKMEIKAKSGELISIELKAFEIPSETRKRHFAGIIRDLRDRLRIAYEYDRLLYGLEDMGYIDPVTQIPNQKYFHYRLESYIESAQHEGVLALIDIDQLNNINQKFGWEAGDDALRKICKDIQTNLRVKDVFGRWEGSSLSVLMPTTSLSDAVHFLDKIRVEVSKLKGLVEGEPGKGMTVSIGCSRILSPRLDIEVYIQQAKAALSKAKSEGKNKMLIHGFYSN